MKTILYPGQKFWFNTLLGILLTIVMVIFLDYPALILFWFFVIDICIVYLYIWIQILRFGEINKKMIIFAGVGVVSMISGIVLIMTALLATKGILTSHDWREVALGVPIMVSFISHLYITRTTNSVTRKFNRRPMVNFLALTFGIILFGILILNMIEYFAIAFETYYLLGFFIYLVYQLVFDVAIYNLYIKESATIKTI